MKHCRRRFIRTFPSSYIDFTLTCGLLLVFEVLDPLLEDPDGVLQAGDGRVELEVEAEGDSDLVVGLRDAARVVGEVLLVAAEARLQVFDGLRVVLAF